MPTRRDFLRHAAAIAASALSICIAASGYAQLPRPAARGKVKSVDRTTKSFVVTMQLANRQVDVTVRTREGTKYIMTHGVKGAQCTFQDVKIGSYATVRGEGSADTGVTANSVVLTAASPTQMTEGIVTSVDAAGRSLVLNDRRAGLNREVTVIWTDETKVFLGSSRLAPAGSTSDIAPGKRVLVYGAGNPWQRQRGRARTGNRFAPISATEIRLLRPLPAGGGAAGRP